MVNYHKVCKILEKQDIDSEIKEILTWLKSKLEIDEKTKNHLKYLYENLHEGLNQLLKKEEYAKEDLRDTMEDYTQYKEKLNTTTCYHCGQYLSGIVKVNYMKRLIILYILLL